MNQIQRQNNAPVQQYRVVEDGTAPVTVYVHQDDFIERIPDLPTPVLFALSVTVPIMVVSLAALVVVLVVVVGQFVLAFAAFLAVGVVVLALLGALLGLAR